MTGKVARLGANVSTDSMGQPLKEGDRIKIDIPNNRIDVELTDEEIGIAPDSAAAEEAARWTVPVQQLGAVA